MPFFLTSPVRKNLDIWTLTVRGNYYICAGEAAATTRIIISVLLCPSGRAVYKRRFCFDHLLQTRMILYRGVMNDVLE